MEENRQYDHEFKVHAVKLAEEIGQAKAARPSKRECMRWNSPGKG